MVLPQDPSTHAHLPLVHGVHELRDRDGAIIREVNRREHLVQHFLVHLHAQRLEAHREFRAVDMPGLP